ncbi:MAG TPA: hypothetical protein PKI19_04535 [Elusimicrobiales bacterium]|nr:hypothetical protein [Elusimicrobiales bacterium]
MNGTGKIPHVWRFFRAGGTDQVLLDRAEDLKALGELDQKLWVTLACPVSGLEFDEKTLRMLDSDGDGRIRVPEVLAAIRWLSGCLKDIGSIRAGADSLPLSEIDDSGEEGKRLLELARQILQTNGKAGADSISVSDMAHMQAFVAASRFNGDGVITLESAAEDSATRGLIEEIGSCMGTVADCGGKPGIDKARIERFFKEADELTAWRAGGKAGAGPLGDRTADAHAACQAVRAKVDDFFARCRTAAFDGRSAAALNRSEAEYAPLAALTLSAGVPELAGFPLARVEAGRALPLDGGVNPAWADAVARLDKEAVKPLLGARSALTEADWHKLLEHFGAQEEWLKSKPRTRTEALGAERLAEILSGGGRATLAEFVEKDLAEKPKFDSIFALERLVRYHRDLQRLLENFVSFADFYGRKRKAVFQAGTLYIDGRSCELCVRVADAGKHAVLAALSQTCLLYCDCIRRGAAEKITIAVAMTGGDSDNLMVGRNGMFYDRDGWDWDATVVKIIEQPISIRQAFWSPYKKAIRLVETQLAKFASEREKTAETALAAGAVKSDKAAPFDVGKFAGIFAAVGLAMGALGAAFGAVVAAVSRLPWWQLPLAAAGAVLLISGPSMIIAALKLRQRNIGPILDANGWAINTLVRINIPFGEALTRIAALPPNSKRGLEDPYAEKNNTPQWLALAVFLLLAAVAWFLVRRLRGA